MKEHLALSLTGFICRCIFVLVTLAALAGCASTAEQMDQLLTEGRADEALSKIEMYRSSQPKDESLIGIERSVRERWLADKLIEVRLLRLSGKQGDSAELMRKVLQNETRWSQIPGGAVFSTQAEETEHLSRFIQSAILVAARKGHPIEAEFRYRQERDLLENTLRVSTKHLKTAIAQSSQTFCHDASKNLSSQDHYTSLFLTKSCAELGVRLPRLKTINSVHLFRTIEVVMNVTGVSPARIEDFQRDLKTEFQKSVWYDDDAKQNLALSVDGPLTEKISTRPASRTRSYMARVPYEEKSVRKAEPKSGLETFFGVLGWLLIPEYRPTREVANADGTVTVYETKYRDEPRDYSYEATEVTQTLSTNWLVHLGPQGKPREFPFKMADQVISDEHSTRFLDARLEPETRKIIRVSDWLLSVNRKLIDRITSELQEVWIDQFCKDVDGSAPYELQHRCLYGVGARIPAAQDDWFWRTYGLDLGQWRQFTASSPVRSLTNN